MKYMAVLEGHVLCIERMKQIHVNVVLWMLCSLNTESLTDFSVIVIVNVLTVGFQLHNLMQH